MAEPLTGATRVDALPGPAIPGDGQVSGDSSLGDLISKATSDLSTLMRQEIQLAKVEMKAEASKAGKGAGMLGGAGGAGYFALLFMSLALMFLLDSFMPIGWAAFIVGAIYTIAAAVLYSQGRKQLNTVDPTPHQTVETLKEDGQWARHPTK